MRNPVRRKSMNVRPWLPVFVALAAAGCGANQKKILDPIPASSALHGAGSTSTEQSSEARMRSAGAVYTMTNAASGNVVLAFPRSEDGALGAPQSYATGGMGSGASLGNQGALALGDDGRWLYVVNAGSNDVSAFRVTPAGLELIDRIASGGDHPVSVTVDHDRVFVLNAGGAGNIQGFRASPAGMLSAIAGSNLPLSSIAAGAAEIGFTPDGNTLVVSEKATNTLSLYAVAKDGSASGPMAASSSGTTPYGFGFDHHGTLVISEAFGGAPLGSAVSSYRVNRAGDITLVSGSVPTDQTAACWIAVQKDGRFAYAANAGSSSLTGYAVGADGALARLDGPATAVAAGPTELCFNRDSRFLYVLSGGAHMIGGYTVDGSGALMPAGSVTIPAGVNGLAAR
jgi:6-phosphogluconolactonase (cycloisomerase 2 family)